MTFGQLSYVIAIAEAGSMNKASELLYVAQPSLTTAVKELEKELGITIFIRSGKGVTLTSEGSEFILYAKQLYSQYNLIKEKYDDSTKRKKQFSVSSQHYSFAVKAFVEMAKSFDSSEYEFAIKETKTLEVITDVASLKSEIGILYLSDFNKNAITKLIDSHGLDFHHLTDCYAHVYMSKNHPLANEKKITFSQLADYPCLSFDQGDNGSFYYSEEILSERKYPRIIKLNDRATVLNLMVGLNAYTLCSGIICNELNGEEYTAVPFYDEQSENGGNMEIGYITKKNLLLSEVGRKYIEEISKYLQKAETIYD